MHSKESLEILMEKLEERERNLVEKIIEPGETILSVAKGNLNEEGNYSEYLLVVTGKRIIKLGTDGKIQKEIDIQRANQYLRR